MAESKAPAQKKKRSPRSRRKAETPPASRGLVPAQVAGGEPPAKVAALGETIAADGGAVLRAYRDPLGGRWQLLAALPVDRVRPTPYQRDLSPTHVGNLAGRIDRLDRFLDPVIAYRAADGSYWTPNGHHRLAAMRELGARAITALVMPDEEIAYKILALNTEKAHNVREKSLEVVRMARALAAIDPRPEREFEVEFEEPSFVTLGLCYEKRGRFAGGAYQPVLRRIDKFQAAALPRALAVREERAAKLLELDDAVAAAVAQLKERGFESPYLKAFVLARINPLRFSRGTADFDETVDKMLAAARRFDAAKVKPAQLARAAGGAAED